MSDIRELEPGVFSVLLEGRSYTVVLDGQDLLINGISTGVSTADPRDAAPAGSAAATGGPQKITAPMPGKVVRILVEEGQAVEAGQGVVVVEAMKMQNEMQAPRAGRVLNLRAREGATVAAGDVLATIE